MENQVVCILLQRKLKTNAYWKLSLLYSPVYKDALLPKTKILSKKCCQQLVHHQGTYNPKMFTNCSTIS